ncbi:MAG TPA: hypothetical protein VF089_11805 [Candidatus Binatia bacterium]
MGILIGAGIYSEVYPLIENNLLQLGDYGKLTFPTVLGIDPWFVIVPFAIIVIGVLLGMDRIDKQRSKATQGN